MGYTIQGSNPRRGKDFPPKRPDLLWGPLSLLFNGYRDSFLWVKQSGHVVDHSFPSSAKVKNACHYTSTSPTHRHGVDIDNVMYTISTVLFTCNQAFLN